MAPFGLSRPSWGKKKTKQSSEVVRQDSYVENRPYTLNNDEEHAYGHHMTTQVPTSKPNRWKSVLRRKQVSIRILMYKCVAHDTVHRPRRRTRLSAYMTEASTMNRITIIRRPPHRVSSPPSPMSPLLTRTLMLLAFTNPRCKWGARTVTQARTLRPVREIITLMAFDNTILGTARRTPSFHETRLPTFMLNMFEQFIVAVPCMGLLKSSPTWNIITKPTIDPFHRPSRHSEFHSTDTLL